MGTLWPRSLAASLIILGALAGRTQASDVHSIAFVPGRQDVVRCPFDSTLATPHGYECEIVLAQGERVSEGDGLDQSDWDPQFNYEGDPAGGFKNLTPHLVIRPARLGLRQNVVLFTTSNHTYRIMFESVKGTQPRYYAYDYTAEARRKLMLQTQHDLQERAIALQTALRDQAKQVPHAQQLTALEDLAQRCLANSDYTIGKTTATVTPLRVCNDAEHLYIQFPPFKVSPTDVPVLHAVANDEEQLVNAPFDPVLNRYVVDGVYDRLVLLSGSQRNPVRQTLYRYAADAEKKGRK